MTAASCYGPFCAFWVISSWAGFFPSEVIYTNRRKMLLAVCVLALLVCTVVFASLWILSNMVTVDVKMVPLLSLAAPSSVYLGQAVNFSGSLMLNGTAISNATVIVYDLSSMVDVAYATTDGSGLFSCAWTPLEAREYQFRAKYLAP